MSGAAISATPSSLTALLISDAPGKSTAQSAGRITPVMTAGFSEMNAAGLSITALDFASILAYASCSLGCSTLAPARCSALRVDSRFAHSAFIAAVAFASMVARAFLHSSPRRRYKKAISAMASAPASAPAVDQPPAAIDDGAGALLSAVEEEHTGSYDGLGFSKFRNGNTYQGEFKEFKIHGRGEYSWTGLGVTYDGQFEDNQMRGEGRYAWPDGSVYEGQVLDGLRHGHGVFTGPHGMCRYAGEWRAGRRHGEGKLEYDPQGASWYEGGWEADQKHGQVRSALHPRRHATPARLAGPLTLLAPSRWRPRASPRMRRARWCTSRAPCTWGSGSAT